VRRSRCSWCDSCVGALYRGEGLSLGRCASGRPSFSPLVHARCTEQVGFTPLRFGRCGSWFREKTTQLAEGSQGESHKRVTNSMPSRSYEVAGLDGARGLCMSGVPVCNDARPPVLPKRASVVESGAGVLHAARDPAKRKVTMNRKDMAAPLPGAKQCLCRGANGGKKPGVVAAGLRMSLVCARLG
jgi:hypothetical protein